MKYPIDFEKTMEEAEQSGIHADGQCRDFMQKYVESLNDAYYQARLDEAMNRE